MKSGSKPVYHKREVKWCRVRYDDNERFKRREAKARMYMKTKSIKQTRSTGE